MLSAHARINRYLQSLGNILQTPLSIDGGVCALFDGENRECAVIETSENSEIVIFHCEIVQVKSTINPLFFKRVLELNFKLDILHGTWLAMDRETLRLCCQIDINIVDEKSFCNFCIGFIDRANYLREKIPRWFK